MSRRMLVFWLLLLVCLRVAGAVLIPAVQDEAYYALWARHLDWGYLDHPPMVALFAAPGSIWEHIFAVRAVSLLSGFVLVWVFYQFAKLCGFSRGAGLTVSVLLFCFNLCGFVGGFLVTPDIPMMLFWGVALYFTAVAITWNPRAWIFVGIATGLGMMSKYTMVLAGLVYLTVLVRHRGVRRSPWPYLGLGAALITMLPHLYWNTKNDWASVRFQIGHGIGGHHRAVTTVEQELSAAMAAAPGSREARMGQYFITEAVKPRPPPPGPVLRSLKQGLDYLGGQFALWGFFGFLFLWHGVRSRFARRLPWRSPRLATLCWSATLVPLGFFFLVSFKSPVEANWAAMSLFSGALLLGGWLKDEVGSIQVAALLNVVAFVLVIYASLSPLGALGAKGRIFEETYGFDALSEAVRELEGPVFADRYQLVSMLRFYDSRLEAGQYPGVTRTSELLRRPELRPDLTASDLSGGFHLIMSNSLAPHIPGFDLQSLEEWRLCPDGWKRSPYEEGKVFQPPSCGPSRRWYLAHYTL